MTDVERALVQLNDDDLARIAQKVRDKIESQYGTTRTVTFFGSDYAVVASLIRETYLAIHHRLIEKSK